MQLEPLKLEAVHEKVLEMKNKYSKFQYHAFSVFFENHILALIQSFDIKNAFRADSKILLRETIHWKILLKDFPNREFLR